MKKINAVIVTVSCILLFTGALYASAQYGGNKTKNIDIRNKQNANTIKSEHTDKIISQEEAEKNEGLLPDSGGDNSIGDPDYFPEIPGREDVPDELDDPADQHDYLSKYEGQYVEFVGFTDQQISNEFQSFIIPNLSSNDCNIVFEFCNGGNTFYKSQAVAPGISDTVNLYRLLGEGVHKMTVISQAYALDGTQLNAISQDITVTVKKSNTEAENNANVYADATDGNTFQTTVVYKADTTNYSVAVPAAISIVEGTKGTEFMIGFRVQNLKEGNTLSLASASGLNNDEKFLLAHESSDSANTGSIKYVVSSDTSKEGMVVGYNFKENDTLIHWVGPAYCIVGDGKQAAATYYGTMVFNLREGGVNDAS